MNVADLVLRSLQKHTTEGIVAFIICATCCALVGELYRHMSDQRHKKKGIKSHGKDLSG